jgi:Dynamin central region/Dynamin family/Dynamin GTPase effector domain
MGVPVPGQPLVSGLSTFSDDVLKIELCGPKEQHLSIIDVPGIFRTPTEGVTTKEDVGRVQGMVKSYIKGSRTIILAVVPANVDIATQEILSMAEEADPLGERTMGVLTKPDLVDGGAEEAVMDLVRGTKNKLNLGYCIVRNRGQQHMEQSTADRHMVEKAFFSSEPWSKLDKERVGIPALQDRLRELLVDITRREFPNVKREIDKRLSECEKELQFLGPARETEDQQRTFLLDMATKFQEMTSHALDGYYNRNSLFEERISLRLATRVADLHTTFSDDMWKKGHTMEFSKSPNRKDNKPVPEPISDDITPANDTPDEADQALTADTSPSTTEMGELENSRFLDLSDVIQAAWQCPPPKSGNILDWIKAEYRRSRGFELGTFNPAVLPVIFQEQSKKWEPLALAYVSDVIQTVHSFADDLLSALCPDIRVRSSLWELMIEKMVDQYRKAISHTHFLLHVERQETPMTSNHYFNSNLQKARLETLKATLKPYATLIQFDDRVEKNMVDLDAISGSIDMDNIEHMVDEIHAILKSYYKVARKRFVDNVSMQVAQHFLVTGSESPLRLFMPSFVHHLSPDSLNMIAGEDSVTRRKRSELVQQIQSLKDGKKILRA